MSKPVDIHIDKPFRVAGWLVDPANNQIQLDNKLVKLEPRVMDVLVYLAQHQGQVISREELEENIWAGRVVSYDSLTTTIVKLRKAFQDDNNVEPVIKTIPKRGYSLIAKVRILEQPTLEDNKPSHSIKQTVSETDSQTGDIIQKKNIKPFHPAFVLAAILLVITSLVLFYIFDFNKDIDSKITTSDALNDHTDSQFNSTPDIEALTAFNAGWEKFLKDTPDDYRAAIALFKRATLLDPDYGQAHAALAALYWNIWKRHWHIMLDTAPIPHTWELTDTALQDALKHPTPLAYQVSSGMLYMNRRYDEAIAEAQKAIKLAPNNPVSHAALANALVYAGSPEIAKASIDKAMQLNPRYPADYLFTLGLIYFNTQQYDKAAGVLEQAVSSSPLNHNYYIHLIAVYGHLGKLEKIPPLLAKANRLRKDCQLPLLNVSSPINPYPYQPWPFNNQDDVIQLQTGLRAAGLPEY